MTVERILVVFLCCLLFIGAVSFTGPVQVGPACTSNIALSQTTSTDLKTFTNTGYICDIQLVSATAQSVSLAQGTGTTCATSTVALIGSTTAANGMALAANGGFVNPIPAGSYLKTSTTAQHLCLLQSGSGLVAGFILYTDAP